MSWTLNYTASLVSGTGITLVFSGTQPVSAANPQSSDLTAAANAMNADIAAQLVAGYPAQTVADGDNAALGGHG